ncbi:crotonobetainyl-CoA:carnitine CoA-transferase CaiB-like acyl-CoA transferase [Bradyrhizobium sp. USDA 4524]|uniref:CaiB/BaiF CoA transferase family protein n=1 Tax=Bradyrhizobium TaxID=374 RepID=UPI00209D3F86|nr:MULTISPECIES: CoA transferase [Bradyrhizobium]MCP1845125.1 crotonobetainyl-CoA:carnitine CoA-transferase CaiB-like acyl-CoA transferase [Bradyrhizobium sp. USDA 4538]MCP1905690.1 crotonobetainyl-CoA:carnitine CoA-transferase CaiB-like acyl-CoA transferase [Bradyrhizobium sp. USDA 4537]MCP1988654.1 crotonobetainyl-CoA:carnitine CoA-transferase CaiB-like acyl-CoA transferase [Bradyrhizobium sp. USDA 4539]MCP3418143.1 CoA transferase [Bradyrhizobium brasilense]
MLDDYAGVRVLDVSQGFAGPYCGAILARGGASVIKVEPPSGDWARAIGGAVDGHTAFSLVPNIGKRAVCIDGIREQGRALLVRLAKSTDIVIQNFRPGVVDRLQIADHQLRPDNPDLIYVSILGFGAGPYEKRPATDTIIQGFTGMMEMNRDSQDTPRRIGMLAVDTAAGVYAAQQVGAALYRRLTKRGGQHVKISLVEVAAAFQAMPIVDDALRRRGQPNVPLSVPIGTFATADGHINLSCVSNAMFHGICKALGKADWILDPRFVTEAGRLDHAGEITAEVARILHTRPSVYWIEAFERHDVLCGPVQGYREFLDDPHVRGSGLQATLQGGAFEGLPLTLLPGTSAAGARLPAPPRLGEHTTEVLAEHGYSQSEIDRFIEDGTIVQAKTEGRRQ